MDIIRKNLKELSKNLLSKNKEFIAIFGAYMIIVSAFSMIDNSAVNMIISIFEIFASCIITGMTIDICFGRKWDINRYFNKMGKFIITSILIAIYALPGIISTIAGVVAMAMSSPRRTSLMAVTPNIGLIFLGIILIGVGIVYSFYISLTYNLSLYTIFDEKYDENMSSTKRLAIAKEFMNGHKMEYLILQLSFILWILLILITCGIATIYVSPYMAVTNCLYYLKISENNSKEIIKENIVE